MDCWKKNTTQQFSFGVREEASTARCCSDVFFYFETESRSGIVVGVKKLRQFGSGSHAGLNEAPFLFLYLVYTCTETT